jgi:hypothetical protein
MYLFAPSSLTPAFMKLESLLSWQSSGKEASTSALGFKDSLHRFSAAHFDTEDDIRAFRAPVELSGANQLIRFRFRRTPMPLIKD